MSFLGRLVTSSWRSAATLRTAATGRSYSVAAATSTGGPFHQSNSKNNNRATTTGFAPQQTTVGWLSNLNSGIIARSFASKKHKSLLKHAKGYRGRSKNCYSVAVRRVEKGWQYAYRDRKRKRREHKKVWIQRISAGVRQYAWSYSSFMRHLYGGGRHRSDDPLATLERSLADRTDSGIRLNRKVLSELAAQEPLSFKAVIDVVEEVTGVYKEPAQYTAEDGWDFEGGDNNGDVGGDDYYYDPDTSEWVPKQQQQQQQQEM